MTDRPAWLTDTRLRRLAELSESGPHLATADDNGILGTAAMIFGSAGHIVLTDLGWDLLRRFGKGAP
jgi:hypothetical protein